MTNSYVLLSVSERTYREILDKLRAADYHHCLVQTSDPETPRIVMTGIAIVPMPSMDCEDVVEDKI